MTSGSIKLNQEAQRIARVKFMMILSILQGLFYLVMVPVTGFLTVALFPKHPVVAIAMFGIFIISVVSIFDAVSDFRKHKENDRA